MMMPTPPSNLPPNSLTKVAIIGAGRGGTHLIEIFHDDPLVQIIGVADLAPQAVGMILARKLGIPVTTNYQELLESKKANLVIDVTGDASLEELLYIALPPGMAIIGGPSAKFMWQLIEERRQSKEKIEQHLLEYQSLYRLYVKEVELAIAEERTRIACDIHDGLVQTLVGLNYHLEYCTDQMEKDPARAIEAVKETKRLLKEGIAEAREVIFNLRPIYLDRSGLYQALRNYLKTYEKQYQIKTLLATSGDEEDLPSEAKIFVFRIIQEALANVQRHAEASSVSVKVCIEKGQLEAEISDNGIGFRPKQAPDASENGGSFGLKAISERARLLGGEAHIVSKMGEGTKVLIQVPLSQVAAR